MRSSIINGVTSDQPTPLMQAVRAYKQYAAAQLTPEQVGQAIQLLKALNQRLPKQNLLVASKEEIREAGMQALEALRAPKHGGFLTAELNRFFDVALEQGLIHYHPLRGTARLREEPAVVDDVKPDSTQRAAEVAAQLVAGIIQDTIQTGMMVSPLAGPLTSRNSGPSAAEKLIVKFTSRWEVFANRSRLILSITQIAIPAITIVLAIMAVFDPSGPFAGGHSRAMDAGNAVRMLRVMVNEIYWEQEGLEDIRDLDELMQQWGGSLGPGTEDLELLRVVPDAHALYLRNRAANTIVIVSPELSGVFSRGRWRMRE